jgi:hypothetical protein
LGPVIAEILGAGDVEISGLQGVGQMDKDAVPSPPSAAAGHRELPGWFGI